MESGKKKFLTLVAVFVTPVVLGSLLFFNLERLGFEKGSTNYGTLVHPALPAVVADLKQGDVEAVREETIAKSWTMAYIEPSSCDQVCLDKLTLIKKVRLLTNEKMRRVRTLFITNPAIADSIDEAQYRDMVISNVTDENSTFLKQFPHQETKPIYLIDPYGNIMMYYPQADLNAKKIIKDINRLLKYSQLG
ncbi:MAG: cytochrome oxidase Cu insertion factor (SCO1/SenC/PrrC family) [Cocleimonas sp.]|jgi:cytochrome oxidase Cu insertion factor (SCO1/SenC/PrrC family)